jgi:pimeloyl-ACP methyl ester carboxylesterase
LSAVAAAPPTAVPAVAHPPGRHIPVGDTRLWIEEEGAGEPVLLLAGGPASSHVVFHPAFGALAESHRVIYLDYRGRGRSEPVEDPQTITFAGDVADVVGLIRTLGPVHVYGFSYGGVVAQALALDHPELVKRLVLANTLHSPEMWQRNHENINWELELQYPEVWDQILAFRAQGVRSTDPRVQQLYAVHSRLVRFYDPDNASKVPSEPSSKNAALYPVFVGDDVEFFIGGEVARLPDFRPRLHTLRMPVMILAGRYDRALCPRYQLDFARSAPQAEFHWMERSGTFSHIEEADAVMTLLRRFFADARGSTRAGQETLAPLVLSKESSPARAAFACPCSSWAG